MDNGFIDLGKKYNSGIVAADKPKEMVNYPTLFISHDMGSENGLDELPDGEFEFTGRARIASYKEDMKNGTCSCEIEVMAIKPSSRKAKKKKSSEESLDEAITTIVKNKTKS